MRDLASGKTVGGIMTDWSKHRVLIVNDDGIHAPGIQLLEKIVRRYTDNVWVVAPDEEKSGASHSISMHVPVRIRQIDERHYAVKGTPTDCALLAIYEIMKERPTMLLSGINRGANLAEDITYSGTAAAAMEGALLGVPSVALSQVFTPRGHVPWETAEAYAPRILDTLFATEWQPGTFVNVNFPDALPDAVTGVRVVRQGQRPPGSFLPEGRIDGRDVPYYWIKLAYKDGGFEPGSDLEAIRDKAVSVNPIQLDMTAERFRTRLESAFG
jgi:5'-nucleotidase